MHIPSIFWTTAAALFLIAGASTLIGRTFCRFFPPLLRPRATFYLAPALGLAAMLSFVAVWGRYLPFGESVLFPLLVAVLLVVALSLEVRPRQALAHAGLVSAYALFTASPFLIQLFRYGGYNPFHDAFTYLAHGDWLQHHAFGKPIPADSVTPAFTQVFLYQGGLRMGASYLLGLFQSLLSVRWSYEIYPAVILAPTAATCLACGFALAPQLRRLARLTRLLILSIPAFGLGGVVFANSYGFLPQSYGQMFAAATVFASGAVLPVLGKTALPAAQRLLPAAPIALLLAASIFTYPELSPFVVLVLGVGAIGFAVMRRAFVPHLVFAAVTVALTALLLNVEIERSVVSLLAQRNAVVGNAVDWSLLGFLAHALGTHGGAWDILQWTNGTGSLRIGAAITLLVLAAVVVNIRGLKQACLEGPILLSGLIVVILACALLVFRYAAANPFGSGTGQSWSQFKLTDWAHPFMFSIVAGAILAAPRFGALFRRGMIVAAIATAIFGLAVAPDRFLPVRLTYPGIRDWNKFYLSVRGLVADRCPGKVVYLGLNGSDHKLRQMLALLLDDWRLKADWRDDGYISSRLPIERRNEAPEAGDCMIERAARPDADGLVYWMLRIGTVPPR